MSFYAKGHRQTFNIVYSNVSCLPFNVGDKGSVQTTFKCQRFLRPSL
jgi:hypothetical protein